MKKVQFPLVFQPDTSLIEYPDNIALFGASEIVNKNTIYADYSGDLPLDLQPLPVTLTIEGDKANNVMQLGETLSFTATFSDLTINAAIPVSIVNREDIHVANAFVTIVDGIGTGTFTPDRAVDYFVTEEAINFHTKALNTHLTLIEPFYIRVVQS